MKRIIAAVIISLFFAGISFAGTCVYDSDCGYSGKCVGQYGKKFCTPK
jgi:hypothetical protein